MGNAWVFISFNPSILNDKVLQLEFISGIGIWLVADCWKIKEEIRPIVLESIYFCKINKVKLKEREYLCN